MAKYEIVTDIGKKEFESLQALRSWGLKEQGLLACMYRDKDFMSLVNINQSFIEREDQNQSQIERLIRAININYRKCLYVSSESADGKFLIKLYERYNKSQCYQGYAWLLLRSVKYPESINQNVRKPSVDQKNIPPEVIIEVSQYLQGGQEAVQAKEEQFDTLIENITTQSDKIISEIKTSGDDVKSIEEDIRNLLNTNAQQFEDLKQEKEEQFNQLYGTSEKGWGKFNEKVKEEFENLKKAYNEEIQLQAPVKYWKKRIKKSRKNKKLSLIITLVSASIAVLGFLGIAYVEMNTTLSTLPFYKLAFCVFLAIFIIWFVYICVKVYLSFQHLQNEAEQKQVMVQVYLALLKEGASDQQKRALEQVMHRLFEPSFDGLTKEIMPPNLLNIKQLSGK
ncbi:MAG: DUF6161 domain-containing protein [Pseudomonadota bacterium]